MCAVGTVGEHVYLAVVHSNSEVGVSIDQGVRDGVVQFDVQPVAREHLTKHLG